MVEIQDIGKKEDNDAHHKLDETMEPHGNESVNARREFGEDGKQEMDARNGVGKLRHKIGKAEKRWKGEQCHHYQVIDNSVKRGAYNPHILIFYNKGKAAADSSNQGQTFGAVRLSTIHTPEA